jgi:hypothetical protein
MSRVFIDTEFIESGWGEPIHLLSLGLVHEDGREYYAVVKDAPTHLANDWVRENVLPHLADGPFRTREEIREDVFQFLDGDTSPFFIGYFADYDWVVFCSLFGRMVDLPSGFQMYCGDLKQWAVQLGVGGMPELPGERHHALEDARRNKRFWESLINRSGEPVRIL